MHKVRIRERVRRIEVVYRRNSVPAERRQASKRPGGRQQDQASRRPVPRRLPRLARPVATRGPRRWNLRGSRPFASRRETRPRFRAREPRKSTGCEAEWIGLTRRLGKAKKVRGPGRSPPLRARWPVDRRGDQAVGSRAKPRQFHRGSTHRLPWHGRHSWTWRTPTVRERNWPSPSRSGFARQLQAKHAGPISVTHLLNEDVDVERLGRKSSAPRAEVLAPCRPRPCPRCR